MQRITTDDSYKISALNSLPVTGTYNHPFLAKEYEQLKLSLWHQFEHDRDGYNTEAKGDFIRKCTSKAKLIYKSRYQIS